MKYLIKFEGPNSIDSIFIVVTARTKASAISKAWKRVTCAGAMPYEPKKED
jgi:hypothetical protein